MCILGLQQTIILKIRKGQKKGRPSFPQPQSDVFELVLLSNQQFKIQTHFIYYHTCHIKQQIITSDKLGSVDVSTFWLENDDACN